MGLIQRFKAAVPREGQLLLAAAVIMVIPAWVKGINLLMLVAFLLLAVVAVNWIAAKRQVRRLTASRRWLGPIFAGSEAHWEVEVGNGRALPASGFRVIDAGPSHRQEWFVTRLPGGEQLRVPAAVTLPRRGRYHLDPLVAASLFPFGLAQSNRAISATEDCVVLPRLGRINVARFQRWLTKMTRGDARMHRIARPSMIHQDDLHGLRPFRPGDNPRWIHWRTSARRNQKMVREFEEDAGQNLILILEPWTTNFGRLDAKLEATISLAATLAWEWCRQSMDYLMLGVAGSKPHVTSGYASHDNALDMLRSLALAEGESFVDPVPLLKAVSSSIVPDAPVLLISQRESGPLHQRLAESWNRPILALTPSRAAEFYDAPPPARLD
jgi:uncharacterized protein (DUF58 family)